MFWKISLKYSFSFLIAASNLSFAASKKSAEDPKSEKHESLELISKGDGYEFKYTKDWKLYELDDGGASLHSKNSNGVSMSVTLLPKTSKSMQIYLEGERVGNPRKRFIFGEMTKVDGRDAALILEVAKDDEKDVDSQYSHSFEWGADLFCAGQVFSLGYSSGHLNKEERAEARKQRVPPKEFQEFLSGFKCLKD